MCALVAIEADGDQFPEKFVAPVAVADVMAVDRACLQASLTETAGSS